MGNKKKEKNEKFKNLGKAIEMELREHKSSALYILLCGAL